MRCNLLHPWFLADQHLIAERRELRMIPPLVEKRIKSRRGLKLFDDVPGRYTLNTGHMRFWINKLEYLEKRFAELSKEMTARGFKPDPNLTLGLENLKDKYGPEILGCYRDWTPEPSDYNVIVARLREKIEMKFDWYRYCSLPITRKWFEVTYPVPY